MVAALDGPAAPPPATEEEADTDTHQRAHPAGGMATEYHNTAELAADLLACLDEPLLAARLCDVVFVLQPPPPAAAAAAAGVPERARIPASAPPARHIARPPRASKCSRRRWAVSGVVAARSAGLRALLGGDLRSG